MIIATGAIKFLVLPNFCARPMIRLLPKERKNKSASLLLVLPNLSLELCSLASEATIGRAANSHLFHSRITNSAEHKRVSVVSPALSGRDSSDSHIINGIYTEYDWLLFIVFVLSTFKYKRRKEFFFRKKS